MCMSHATGALACCESLTNLAMDSVEIADSVAVDADTIPIIFLNEQEISYETYIHLPKSLVKSDVFLDPERSVKLIGEKGKNGILYVSTRKKMDMWYGYINRKDYYFTESDFPAEFPGGTDGLIEWLKGKRYVPDSMDKIHVGVHLDCYIDKDGTCEKAEVEKIIFFYPEHVEVKFRDGKMANSEIISPKYKEYLKYFRERALDIAKDFPKFKPAQVWFSNVKYKVNVPIGFAQKGAHYDLIDYSY